ncbi:hypothetical protein [Streptomyces sp. NPDC059176]|uniref:hypothetical protein n=1 Tax=unclassified Streptomyces TaxID=2593676 RepID=UPI0036C6194D
MTETDGPNIHGLPDGGAELSVVLRLRWDDVAALGREASRLAEQRGAPVSLDEAASHRLRTWSAVAKTPEDKNPAVTAAPTPTAITGSTPGDRSRVHVPGGEATRVAAISPHAARQVPATPTTAGSQAPA